MTTETTPKPVRPATKTVPRKSRLSASLAGRPSTPLVGRPSTPLAGRPSTPLAGRPSTPFAERPTSSLEPSDVKDALDALPLLDHRTRRRTIPVGLAPRGHYLALANGDETRLLRLEENITHVGRGPGSDVCFDEHRVSRSHAIFVRHGRHFRLLDNRSSNGTFVNGRRIVATNIENGDVILAGPVEMRYLAID